MWHLIVTVYMGLAATNGPASAVAIEQIGPFSSHKACVRAAQALENAHPPQEIGSAAGGKIEIIHSRTCVAKKELRPGDVEGYPVNDK
jgi:hypothetical protein